MERLTKENIQFIDNYLLKSEVIYKDIRVEMVDHVANAVEERMQTENDYFYDAFKAYMVQHKKELLESQTDFVKQIRKQLFVDFFRSFISLKSLMMLTVITPLGFILNKFLIQGFLFIDSFVLEMYLFNALYFVGLLATSIYLYVRFGFNSRSRKGYLLSNVNVLIGLSNFFTMFLYIPLKITVKMNSEMFAFIWFTLALYAVFLLLKMYYNYQMKFHKKYHYAN